MQIDRAEDSTVIDEGLYSRQLYVLFIIMCTRRALMR
jgi:hypothetical protein